MKDKFKIIQYVSWQLFNVLTPSAVQLARAVEYADCISAEG